MLFSPPPVWPDWAIYWTLANFLKPLAAINLPKSPTFWDNFCKGVKVYHFSSEIIIGQLLSTIGDFFLVTLAITNIILQQQSYACSKDSSYCACALLFVSNCYLKIHCCQTFIAKAFYSFNYLQEYFGDNLSWGEPNPRPGSICRWLCQQHVSQVLWGPSWHRIVTDRFWRGQSTSWIRLHWWAS